MNKVLVAGASGLVGLAAARRFLREGWQVVALSRRRPEGLDGSEFLSIDLLDAEACRVALSRLEDITHVVYAAVNESPGLFQGWIDEDVIARNGAMLRNLFEPLLEASPGLQQVSLLHGTKAYGLHHPGVGKEQIRVPLREREPRVLHPNFYFLQEDYLTEQQRKFPFALTIFRPTVIYGDALGSNMNPILVIAAYAALLRERGEPLHFPGQGGQAVIREAIDADLVAAALRWAAEAPQARNETFNLTNGDVFVWDNVWPAIADALGMDVGEHRPLRLAEDLPARQQEWASLVERHALGLPGDLLECVGYNSLVYTDMVLNSRQAAPLPFLNSTVKARLAGFSGCIDTEDMFRRMFAGLVETGRFPGKHATPPG